MTSADIFLLHGPIHIHSINAIARGMAGCLRSGLTECVGVANYRAEDMLKFADELGKYEVPLSINQCDFSMLRRQPELSGLLQTCKERGMTI